MSYRRPDKIKIKSGTKVFESEIGHNNFFYPSDNMILVSEDCVAERLNWLGSNELTPFKVPLDALGHKDLWDRYAVVWVMNELIEKGAQRLRQGNKEE